MDRLPLRLPEWSATSRSPRVARLACLAWLATLLAPAASSAQTSRTDRVFPATFETVAQSMWGAGTAPLQGVDKTFTFADVSWNKSATAGGVETVLDQDFGAEIAARSAGAFGVFARLRNIGTGGIGVKYPVSVMLGIPDPNTFKDGEPITITSSVSLMSGAAIIATPPRADVDFRAKAAISAAVDVRFCFFDCVNAPLFPAVDVGSNDIPLFGMSVNPQGQDFISIGGLTKNLPYTLGFVEQQLTNMSGTVGLPKVLPTTATGADGLSLAANGDHTFIDLSLDLDGFFTGKIPLGFQSPELYGFQAGYETVDFSGVLKVAEEQKFTFTPRVFAVLTFPRAVDYAEKDATNTTINIGTATAVRFRAGNSLQVIYPAGLKSAMTVTPTFEIENDFTSSTVIKSREDIVLTVGKIDLKAPAVTLVPEFTVDVCEGLTVDADPLDIIPDEHCPATSPAVRSPEINVHLGPLYQQSLVGTGQQFSVFPLSSSDCGCWSLQGFNTVAGGTFQLDPENPIIAVASTIASGNATGGAPGTIVQSVQVSNVGDVPLSMTQVADALSAAVPTGGAFAVRNVASPTLTRNPAFNGVSDARLLTRADVLQVGGSGSLAVTVGVEPGNLFKAMLEADGTSVLGTTVRASTTASFGVYYFDIRPSTLSASGECDHDDDSNAKGVCVLPAVVFGSRGMDVSRIDPASLRLIGVKPLKWSILPHQAGDGDDARRGKDTEGRMSDLSLKFDRSLVLAALTTSLTVASLAPVGAANASLASPGEATQIGLSPLDADMVARALLGESVTLTPAQLRAADRNGNGTIDVGDLRAALATAAAAAALQKGDAGIDSPKPQKPSRVLVLTGLLKDGTPFMGEDLVYLANNGNDR
jgi:hypothetical protein